jgi:hypothetical protein
MKILILIILSFANVFAGNVQVHYEPSEVELSGQLDLQTFPGPPNYESIKSGDEPERHYYLILHGAVDVILEEKDKASSINGDSLFNVKVLQLVIGKDEHWKILRQIGEKGKAKIRGTIFQRHTGHHHSRVLLDVKDIQMDQTKTSH